MFNPSLTFTHLATVFTFRRQSIGCCPIAIEIANWLGRTTSGASFFNAVWKKTGVKMGMISLICEKLKIANCIVQSIAVSVVDDFRRQELSTKALLHNMPMLKHSFSIDVNDFVAIRGNGTICKSVMRSCSITQPATHKRTKALSTARPCLDRLAAHLTRNCRINSGPSHTSIIEFSHLLSRWFP